MTSLQALNTLLAPHAPLLQNNIIVSLVIPFTNSSSDSDVTFLQSAGTSKCYSQHCLHPVCTLHVCDPVMRIYISGTGLPAGHRQVWEHQVRAV